MKRQTLNNVLDSKKLFVFDFDGVLIDSVHVKTQAFALMYQPYGTSVVDKVVRHHKANGGVSRFKKFKYYHKTYLGKDLDQADIESMSNQFSDLVVSEVVASEWISGAKSFLQKLHKEKMNCVIVSATPQDEIELIVKKRGMGKYFSGIYGSPSSKYENLSKAMKKFSVTPRQMVFFGDALADWEASAQMGVPFVGVGEEIKDILRQHEGSNVFIDNFEIINE